MCPSCPGSLKRISNRAAQWHSSGVGAGAIQNGRSKTQAVPVMGRQFALVADRKHCITGSIFPDDNVEGVFTLNRGLVTNVVDLVKHEIYLELILLEVGKPVWDLFGKNLAKLNAFDPPIEKSDKDRA